MFSYFKHSNNVTFDVAWIENEKRREMFKTAYRQYFISEIMDSVKLSAENYKDINKPGE